MVETKNERVAVDFVDARQFAADSLICCAMTTHFNATSSAYFIASRTSILTITCRYLRAQASIAIPRFTTLRNTATSCERDRTPLA